MTYEHSGSKQEAVSGRKRDAPLLPRDLLFLPVKDSFVRDRTVRHHHRPPHVARLTARRRCRRLLNSTSDHSPDCFLRNPELSFASDRRVEQDNVRKVFVDKLDTLRLPISFPLLPH